MLESCCSAHGFPSLLWLDFKRETVYSTQIILTAPVSYYKIINQSTQKKQITSFTDYGLHQIGDLSRVCLAFGPMVAQIRSRMQHWPASSPDLSPTEG